MQLKQVFEHYQRQKPLDGRYKFCPMCGTSMQPVTNGGVLRSRCISCGFIQHRNPAPTVSVLILDGERVLLGKRARPPGEGTWALPSGYVEFEDDFLTTAVREAREETGLDVEVTSIINVISSFVTPGFHFLGIYVAARVVGGEPAAADDLEEAVWFPVHGPLPEMGFEEDMDILRLYRSGFTGIPVGTGMLANLNDS